MGSRAPCPRQTETSSEPLWHFRSCLLDTHEPSTPQTLGDCSGTHRSDSGQPE